MIYTSYFGKLKALSDNVTPISVCGKAPDWYTGLHYKVLAPKYAFFMEWKENHDNDFYIKHFQEEVLDMLMASEVLKRLQDKVPNSKELFAEVPVWLNKDHHIALICYEKPDDFCHRHLVADWLGKRGVLVQEFDCPDR